MAVPVRDVWYELGGGAMGSLGGVGGGGLGGGIVMKEGER